MADPAETKPADIRQFIPAAVGIGVFLLLQHYGVWNGVDSWVTPFGETPFGGKGARLLAGVAAFAAVMFYPVIHILPIIGPLLGLGAFMDETRASLAELRKARPSSDQSPMYSTPPQQA